MWCLKFEKSDKVHYLLVNNLYTIGRKGADITITDDSSVSRKHGTIEIKLDGQDGSCTATITDSSKFGTYFARNMTSSGKTDFVKVNKSVALKDGDYIRIGMQHTLCRLVKESLIIVSSMMDQSTLAKLQSVVARVGGKITNAWQPVVTHLAINQIILNVKVTQALATGTPIVKNSFFEKLYEAIETKTELPCAEDFVPPVVEEGLDNDKSLFLRNPSRKCLFNDRVFIFLNNKQMKRLGPTCTAAGGRALLANNISLDKRAELLESGSTAVLLPPTVPEASLVLSEKDFNDLQLMLAEKSLRLLQEHEIGLALLYNSADVYTNPSFELTADITFTQSTIPSGSVSQAKDTASEMESQVQETLFISRIPETVQCDVEPCTSGESSKKRSHAATLSPSDSPASEAPAKSIKIELKPCINDVFDAFETQKRHSKPAPKRRPPATIPPLSDKAAKLSFDPVKQEQLHSETSGFDAISRQHSNISGSMPDSCIADDSLWSCKADSQQIVESPSAESSSKVPAFCKKIESEISQIPESSEKVGNEKVVAKKAFTPSTVPDEEDLESLSKFDPDLPTVLCTVLAVPLVKQNASIVREDAPIRFSKNSKNFKKFVKVIPAYKNPGSQTNVHSTEPPRIIGGRDLIRHVNKIERVSSHAFDMLGGWDASVQNRTASHVLESQDVNPFA